MPEVGVDIRVVDVAATAREAFGPDGYRELFPNGPDVDWRFELHFNNGARATMPAGATAEQAAAYIAREAAKRRPT